MKRRLEIQLTPLDEAQRLFFDALEQAGFFIAPEESLPVREALGRVSNRAVHALRPVPHFRSTAMDGIAVRAEQTVSASEQMPVELREPDDFIYVDTGDFVPEPFDAVIMIERVRELESGRVQVTQPIASGKNVRPVGEDFQQGEVIIPADFRITPEAVGALLNGGASTMWIKREPRVIYFPTGSELVMAESELPPGKIPETNSQIVKGYLQQWGGRIEIGPLVPDDSMALQEAFKSALERFDMLLVGGGTSMGRGDLTAAVVSQLGRVIVHGVAYHPGHPVVLGLIEQKPVIGLPGYPVAAWFGLQLFVKPLLERYYRLSPAPASFIEGRLAEPIKSVRGAIEFIRVRLEPGADGWRVFRLPGGASRLSSLIRAHGILEIPEDVESLPAETPVRIRLLRMPS
ncbi:MAG: molybdopterin molybdenumtransferase MoeA [Acidobacteria bacterium]|nr:molybdopterin molybdenumtransferase MoeA [Acidobacteriota bacterium]